jgi:hypothetical protein
VKSSVLLNILRESIRAIDNPRFFKTERGYQGELLAQLRRRQRSLELPGSVIVEQEHQKSVPDHGITFRPDIIVHVPHKEGSAEPRSRWNFVAIELKRRANSETARRDLSKLATMSEKLRYPLTVFINMDSARTFAELCPKQIARQTYCFAVRLNAGAPCVTESRGRSS